MNKKEALNILDKLKKDIEELDAEDFTIHIYNTKLEDEIVEHIDFEIYRGQTYLSMEELK